MNFRSLFSFLIATGFCALPFSAQAATSSSATYTIVTDSLDSGGTQVSSASYSGQGSAGTLGETTSVASPSETMNSGFAGQLYEITGLELAPTFNADGTTQQLDATQTLDDGTVLALTGESGEAWSIVSGQIPTGLTLNMATGAVTGTPTADGPYSFTVTVTDDLGNTAQQAFTGNVSLASDTPTMPFTALVLLALLLCVIAGCFLPKPSRVSP